MQIYWNKRSHLHNKRVQLPQDWFGTHSIVFLCERRDLLCSHSKGDILTCEDIKFLRESSPGISFVFI